MAKKQCSYLISFSQTKSLGFGVWLHLKTSTAISLCHLIHTTSQYNYLEVSSALCSGTDTQHAGVANPQFKWDSKPPIPFLPLTLPSFHPFCSPTRTMPPFLTLNSLSTSMCVALNYSFIHLFLPSTPPPSTAEA